MTTVRLTRPSGDPLILAVDDVLAAAVHDAGSGPAETAIALTDGHKTRAAGSLEATVAALRAAGWHGVPVLIAADSIGAQAMPGDIGCVRGYVHGDAKGDRGGGRAGSGVRERGARLGSGVVRIVEPAQILLSAGGAA